MLFMTAEGAGVLTWRSARTARAVRAFTAAWWSARSRIPAAIIHHFGRQGLVVVGVVDVCVLFSEDMARTVAGTRPLGRVLIAPRCTAPRQPIDTLRRARLITLPLPARARDRDEAARGTAIPEPAPDLVATCTRTSQMGTRTGA